MLFICVTGKSWTHPEKTDLPNNNAGIQANVLSSGKIVICYNPTTGPRDIMRIAVSEDGGKTWPHYKVSCSLVRVFKNFIKEVHCKNILNLKFHSAPYFKCHTRIHGQYENDLGHCGPLITCTMPLNIYNNYTHACWSPMVM